MFFCMIFYILAPYAIIDRENVSGQTVHPDVTMKLVIFSKTCITYGLLNQMKTNSEGF